MEEKRCNGQVSKVDSDTLKKKIQELTFQQREEDKTLVWLKKEKMKLLESFPSADTSSYDEIPHFSYILPLVEDVYWLELKEKEMKQEYEKKMLSSKAQHLGQNFLSLSMSSGECVLKPWFEELTELKAQQPGLLNLSAETKRSSSVHNIGYSGKYSANTFMENLTFTVLCETVLVGLKLKSELPCRSKHQMSPTRANLGVWSDIHIPQLEELIIQSVQDCSSVSNVISHVATHIVNDVAPYVIGMPLKKIKKKKCVKKTSDSPATRISDIDHGNGECGKLSKMKDVPKNAI